MPMPPNVYYDAPYLGDEEHSLIDHTGIPGVGGGGGGLSEIWVAGTTLIGNGGQISNAPGGGGDWTGWAFVNGQNFYAHANISIPSSWSEFTYEIYVASTDTGNYTFEMTHQLTSPGDVLDADLNPATVVIVNAGAASSLSISDPQTILNPDSDRLLGIKIRSNNATQTNFGPPVVIGFLLTQVTV